MERYPDARLRTMGKILPSEDRSNFSEVGYLTHCNPLQEPGICDHQAYVPSAWQGTTSPPRRVSLPAGGAYKTNLSQVISQ